MANHQSAKKSIRQTVKRTLENKSRLSRIKTQIKKVQQLISDNSINEAQASFIEAQSLVAKAIAKNVLKANTASRMTSQLAQKLKVASCSQ